MRNCLIHSTTGCPFPTCSPYSAPRVSHRKHLQTLRNVPTFPEIKPYTRNSNRNSFILSCRDLDKPLDFRNVIKSSHSKTTFASVFTYFLKILEYLLHPVWRCFQWVSFKLVVTYYNLLFFYCYFQFFVPSYNVGTYTFYLYAALHLLPISLSMLLSSVFFFVMFRTMTMRVLLEWGCEYLPVNIGSRYSSLNVWHEHLQPTSFLEL